MSYLATYRKNILDRTPITYREIQVGDILEFRYKNKKDNITKIRVVLVVNIFPVVGSWRIRKVHAFSLPELSPGVFKRLLKRIGTPLVQLDERKQKEVSRVIIKEQGKKGEIFYRKISSRFNTYNAYRTYIMPDMKAIKLCEYDWKNKQLGLGIKDENLLQDTDK
jgi:hypothetical protein